jgi:hypothetical protein
LGRPNRYEGNNDVRTRWHTTYLSFMMKPLDDESYSIPSMQTTH